ncbi:MAG: PspC domain-containing protein [Acetobacter sp.]|nr:PspC domain-containing protein [Bacteroides sp.]MCM1340941.1 PspC domain-containing protein [Acetobacter sp.]
MKKLYRNRTEKMISGVCGGIAVYFNIDPTIVRLLWAVISLFSASVPGILLYVICSVVIPEEPDSFDTTGYYHDENR